jgi:hypothetical protein
VSLAAELPLREFEEGEGTTEGRRFECGGQAKGGSFLQWLMLQCIMHGCLCVSA